MSMASAWRLLTLLLMRTYIVPPNTNEKEKIIGGLLNINQFFWVLGGLLIGAGMFALTVGFLGTFAIAVGFVFCFTGLPFALYKKNNLTLYQYIKLKREFKKQTKHLPNKRKEVKW